MDPESPRLKLRFTIMGDPIPKERARTFPKMRSGQVEMLNGHPVMRTRTPPRTKAWEEYVGLIARQARTRARIDRPRDGAFMLGCIFYLSIPKSWPEAKKQQARNGTLRPITIGEPDTSNLLKSIEDGCEGVLWVNDVTVADYGTVDGLPMGKHYSDTPRVEVEVLYPVPPENR